MSGVTEAQVFDCCACRAFAAKVTARLAANALADGSLGALIDVCREIWWHQVRKRDLTT